MTEKNIEKIRHSLAHILASAVYQMFPETKFGIGPKTENGFYYDFELPRTLIPEDLNILEDSMNKIIKSGAVFEGKTVKIAEAKKFFEEAKQPYKIELLAELEAEGKKEVMIYKSGEFVDLCSGPHVDSASELKSAYFKLTTIAGAYWRGDEKNKMLQRIYGIAFATKKELEDFIKNEEEAKKRDHKKMGIDLDLFSFHPECPGMPLWHEKGMIIWNELEALGKKIRKKYDNREIKTPILAKNILWKKSGHWEHYREGMFHFKVGEEGYSLKPMDCPFNILIYKTRIRSYRELPIRYTEIGRVHRHEKSGELNGLLRVQEITQDDSHILLTEDQVEEEIERLIEMVKEYYKCLGLEPEFFLSTRPDDFMGEIKTWDKAEDDLKESLKNKKIKYQIKEKDGAFYGPKIDVEAKDALGRSWQVATIQLDFQIPARFKCEYIDQNGKTKTPVMIHAAIFGAFERMIGILLEHYAGLLPLWLAPEQVRVLPISDKINDYAMTIIKEIKKADLRASLDDSNESLGKKIRNAELEKVPYILIVGEKEEKAGTISIRHNAKGDLGSRKSDEILEMLKKEIREKKIN